MTRKQGTRPDGGPAPNDHASSDLLGFPPGGSVRRDEREMLVHLHGWRAEVALIRRTAAWLRDDPGRARRAGVACEEDAVALAVLLDLLVPQVPHLDPGVRRTVVEACEELRPE